MAAARLPKPEGDGYEMEDNKTTVTFSVDTVAYEDAQEILEMLGLTVEKACEILVHKITLSDGLPFSVTLNDEHAPGMGTYDPIDALIGSSLPPAFLNALGDYLDDYDVEDEEDEDEDGPFTDPSGPAPFRKKR